jgi:hypothetical protein
MADIREISCGACRDEFLAMDEPPDWMITQAALRRTGDLGLCAGHTDLLGLGLYRMLHAGGFIPNEE